jgi:hypothetical protein
MSSLSFRDIARQDSRLSRLASEAKALMALDATFRRLLPTPLADYCRAVRIRDGELVVYADNGVVAARLKMIGPGLLPALTDRGYPASKIRVKVDIRFKPPTKPVKTLAISPAALDRIEEAAASVSNPLVSAALSRLLAHHRRG